MEKNCKHDESFKHEVKEHKGDKKLAKAIVPDKAAKAVLSALASPRKNKE
jgi:hypothetical protein